jgi:predicted ATPase/DNA-binding XRE family transcriptional regulator
MAASTSSSPTFGELLRDYRRRAGYSQEVLAERARLSPAAIAALEQGVRRAPYRDTVAALATALGLADAARREFEDAAAGARRRHRRQDAAGEQTVSGNIPVRLTSFVGREAEMAELMALLNGKRLVTVTGSGGVGKTRIATEIAREFLGEVWNEAWFVDLAPIERGMHVAGAIAEVLGNAAAASSTLPSLAAQLRRRECLLILDNCEHVIDEVALAVGAILRNCPGITILATSRERLAIDGEYVYRLPSLSGTEALNLFEERANASDARVALTANERETGAQICRQLEGIPLAIELAATRVPTLGLDVLNARLRDYVVISGGRDLPQRQRTMYATIAWSYDLLRAAEQKLLRRLSIFRGAITLDAAEVVCTTGEFETEHVSEHMSQLVDKSLVEVRSAVNQGRRYRLLDSVRHFATEKLAEAGESVLIARAHAMRMAAVADDAEEFYATADIKAWDKRFTSELDDARSAIDWALNSEDADDVVLAGRIVGGLRQLWLRSELQAEAWRLAERVLARLDEERFPVVTERLLRLLVQAAPDKATVVAAIERATPIFERIGDRIAIIGTHLALAWRCTLRGEFVEADDALIRAFALPPDERFQHSWMYLIMLETRGSIRARAGRLEEARADFAEWRRRRTLLGITDHRELASQEAVIAFLAGNPHEAFALLEQDVAYRKEAGKSYEYSASEMAALYLTLGDETAAGSLARAALESISLETHWPETSLKLIQHLATVAARSAESVSASRLLGFVDAQYQELKGGFRDPYERASYDILVACLRERLTTEEIERYATEGAQFDLQQAADLALSVVSEDYAE